MMMNNPKEDREKLMSYLGPVSQENHFILRDGTRIRDIFELSSCLKEQGDDFFRYHVTPYKNDFADWIYHSVGDKVLVNSITNVKERSELHRIIEARILDIGFRTGMLTNDEYDVFRESYNDIDFIRESVFYQENGSEELYNNINDSDEPQTDNLLGSDYTNEPDAAEDIYSTLKFDAFDTNECFKTLQAATDAQPQDQGQGPVNTGEPGHDSQEEKPKETAQPVPPASEQPAPVQQPSVPAEPAPVDSQPAEQPPTTAQAPPEQQPAQPQAPAETQPAAQVEQAPVENQPATAPAEQAPVEAQPSAATAPVPVEPVPIEQPPAEQVPASQPEPAKQEAVQAATTPEQPSPETTPVDQPAVQAPATVAPTEQPQSAAVSTGQPAPQPAPQPTTQATVEQSSEVAQPVEQVPVEAPMQPQTTTPAPVEQPAPVQQPAEQTPVESQPLQQPVAEAVADQNPAGSPAPQPEITQATVTQSVPEQQPTEAQPAVQAPAEQPSPEQQPVETQPIAATPAEPALIEQQPVSQNPAKQTPAQAQASPAPAQAPTEHVPVEQSESVQSATTDTTAQVPATVDPQPVTAPAEQQPAAVPETQAPTQASVEQQPVAEAAAVQPQPEQPSATRPEPGQQETVQAAASAEQPPTAGQDIPEAEVPQEISEDMPMDAPGLSDESPTEFGLDAPAGIPLDTPSDIMMNEPPVGETADVPESQGAVPTEIPVDIPTDLPTEIPEETVSQNQPVSQPAITEQSAQPGATAVAAPPELSNQAPDIELPEPNLEVPGETPVAGEAVPVAEDAIAPPPELPQEDQDFIAPPPELPMETPGHASAPSSPAAELQIPEQIQLPPAMPQTAIPEQMPESTQQIDGLTMPGQMMQQPLAANAPIQDADYARKQAILDKVMKKQKTNDSEIDVINLSAEEILQKLNIVDFSSPFIAVAEKKEAAKKAAKKRLKTGVPGFDDLLAGGIPQGSRILLAGGPGSGKTTFSIQQLGYAAENGEKCLFMTFEESEERLIEHMESYGLDPRKYIAAGNLIIKKFEAVKVSRVVEALLAQSRGELLIDIEEILDIIPEGFKPDRIVVDSLSSVASAFSESQTAYRIYVDQLFNLFERMNVTAFIISEFKGAESMSHGNIEEFLADGVVLFYNLQYSNIKQNALEVLKMRSVDHKKKIVPFEFVEGKGIEVYPMEEIFGLKK